MAASGRRPPFCTGGCPVLSYIFLKRCHMEHVLSVYIFLKRCHMEVALSWKLSCPVVLSCPVRLYLFEEVPHGGCPVLSWKLSCPVVLSCPVRLYLFKEVPHGGCPGGCHVLSVYIFMKRCHMEVVLSCPGS